MVCDGDGAQNWAHCVRLHPFSETNSLGTPVSLTAIDPESVGEIAKGPRQHSLRILEKAERCFRWDRGPQIGSSIDFLVRRGAASAGQN